MRARRPCSWRRTTWRTWWAHKLEETKQLYERKLEALNASLNDFKRQNEEKAERILSLEHQHFINDTRLNQSRQENLELVETYKIQMDLLATSMVGLAAADDRQLRPFRKRTNQTARKL